MPEQELDDDDGKGMHLCCPKCGSPKLYYEAGMKLGPLYHCKRCGYTGTFFIRADKKMRQAMQNGIDHGVDYPAGTKARYSSKREFLFFMGIVAVIIVFIRMLCPEYSSVLGFFLYLLIILIYLFLFYRMHKNKR
ncbi:hypothetical protein [uncultured Methanomethylovorans sp.]|uniref:hypothetical protein n=1 Tax=uncultured Methanomethylovorans sp. TaxID=183759 RepID=UPI002AA88A48|nr:hypothetical protein [uncultured Methanomethylovorans sp.]